MNAGLGVFEQAIQLGANAICGNCLCLKYKYISFI